VTNRAREAALITSTAVLTLFALFASAGYQIRRQREIAEASNQAKSAFLASMSHELRTPLNAIIGYSEMLVEEAQDTAQSSFIPDLTKIQLAGKHLLMLINSVLDLSKIEAGKMDLYVESFHVSTLMEEVSSVIRPLAEKNGNRLITQIPPDIGSIHSDGTKLRQTLYNLLSNACKFTQNGSVTFTARRDADNGQERLVFTVVDTGIGMTPAQVQQLFQPFTQADSSVSRRFGGTGLGLALSQRFVQMLGGELSVESRPQAGSTFTVRIPVNTAGMETRDAQSVTTEPATASENLVLAIDDEPSVGDLLTRSLAKYGFRVHVAHTGEEGIRLARKLRPVAITLDVMMPGMDGWTVLSVLKADDELRDIPVVMLTISDSQNLGYTLGATDYLSKPIDRDRLLSVLLRYRNAEPASALVVEDDPDSRELLRRALEGEGWKVRTAENGYAALEAVAEQRPGVILLDLMMPEMDGFEFVPALRQRPENRTIPIIVITAKDLTTDDRLRLNGYVSRILQKGAFQIEDLLSEVSRLVITRVRAKSS
jgi:CheY-like chemotaxis protein/nitrogen-specific signal transduction histidine kinase